VGLRLASGVNEVRSKGILWIMEGELGIFGKDRIRNMSFRIVLGGFRREVHGIGRVVGRGRGSRTRHRDRSVPVAV
jgi:hypothetical protein